MSTVEQAADGLVRLLREGLAGANLRVQVAGEATVQPPAAVVGVPALVWRSMATEPTDARWLVAVVVPVGDRALRQLWGLLQQVVEVLESIDNVSVIRADPAVFQADAVSLPCYEIEIGVAL